MARIFQIWVSHFRSLGPGFRGKQISHETNRPEQSKQGQVWVTFEEQTKAVDSGGTGRRNEKENPDRDWRGQRRRDVCDEVKGEGRLGRVWRR